MLGIASVALPTLAAAATPAGQTGANYDPSEWAPTGDVASSAAPFRARFVVTQDITPDPACGGFEILAQGTGRATRLGRTQALFDECANFVQEPGRVHVYGSAVLTSASGDELHLAVDKAGNLPDPAGNVHVAGPYRVTGGTGRFAGATGYGTTTTETNVTSSVATVKLNGTLLVDRRAD